MYMLFLLYFEEGGVTGLRMNIRTKAQAIEDVKLENAYLEGSYFFTRVLFDHLAVMCFEEEAYDSA